MFLYITLVLSCITNTNEINIVTVIASPKGAAISFFVGLLRRCAPRNDTLYIAFVLFEKKGSRDIAHSGKCRFQGFGVQGFEGSSEKNRG